MLGLKFDIDKAKAASLYVLQHLGGTIDLHKLFKILYFADQKHLQRFGRPVLPDNYNAMKNGPVPSALYDCFKVVRGDGFVLPQFKHFYEAFRMNGYNVISGEKPDLAELSASDREVLDQSVAENRNLDFFALSDKSHDRAWNSAAPDDRMSLMDIAAAAGANEEMLKYISQFQECQQMH